MAYVLAFERLSDKNAAAQSTVSQEPTFRGVLRTPSVAFGEQDSSLFADLPEGFHDDIDSITVAVGGHHTCALEYRPGVDFGGPVRCWGRNDWGQSAPTDDIFVQVLLSYVVSHG